MWGALAMRHLTGRRGERDSRELVEMLRVTRGLPLEVFVKGWRGDSLWAPM